MKAYEKEYCSHCSLYAGCRYVSDGKGMSWT